MPFYLITSDSDYKWRVVSVYAIIDVYKRCNYDNETFDNTHDDLDGFIVDDYTSESDNNDDDDFSTLF